MFNPEDHPHQRLNPLTGDWVLISPHRTKRPWDGAIEPTEDEVIPRHSDNYLCPGATRSSGKVNDQYTSTFVFENDFPALLADTPTPDEDVNTSNDLMQSRKATGVCKVMCFHPYSDLSLPLMKVEEIENVVRCWVKEYTELSSVHKWVQIFENKGKMMGCSNPHPHCQIWGCDFLPNEARKVDKNQLEYFNRKGTAMLMDYIELELKEKTRIVCENEAWLVVVPYWATWPFELMVLPKEVTHRLSDLTEKQQKLLASIMKIFLTKYDNLFKTSFPYSMGWHSAPTNNDGRCCKHWQLHAHYYPPLLRSATVKKHLVGFEMLSGVMRDLTPEKAAALLKNLSDVHYKEQ